MATIQEYWLLLLSQKKKLNYLSSDQQLISSTFSHHHHKSINMHTYNHAVEMIWQFSWHFEAESSFADEEKKKEP